MTGTGPPTASDVEVPRLAFGRHAVEVVGGVGTMISVTTEVDTEAVICRTALVTEVGADRVLYARPREARGQLVELSAERLAGWRPSAGLSGAGWAEVAERLRTWALARHDAERAAVSPGQAALDAGRRERAAAIRRAELRAELEALDGPEAAPVAASAPPTEPTRGAGLFRRT